MKNRDNTNGIIFMETALMLLRHEGVTVLVGRIVTYMKLKKIETRQETTRQDKIRNMNKRQDKTG